MTTCQVRTAADALIDALPLARADRARRIERAAEVIGQARRHNAAARASHTKARRRRLRAIGIRAERLTSCVPP